MVKQDNILASPAQKQLFRGVNMKRCSEDMKQIYRRTFMPKVRFK